MGIINNDNYVTSSGVEKAGTYISFANETLYINQSNSPNQIGPNMYNLRANFRIFWDQAARDAGKSFIDLQSVSVQVTADQLSENPYTHLYNELKIRFSNHSDEVRAVAPSDPAPAADPSAPSEPAAPSDPAPSV